MKKVNLKQEEMEIKKGEYKANYSVKKLKRSLVNRDIVENHSASFEKKIKDFGWLLPVVIDSNNNILEGHHRVLSAERIGLKTVPVYIVDWLDTKDLDEAQKVIISLNNNNRKWGVIDFLKSYSLNKNDYKKVYDIYNKNSEYFAVGAITLMYFNSGCNTTFKDGKAKIKDIEFSNYLLNEIKELVKKHSRSVIQAYSIREFVKFAHNTVKDDYNALQFLINNIDIMAKSNKALLTSITDFSIYLKDTYNQYKNLK
jgi:disulfide oxidoreductase YuzD